ncbi:MAG: hypothetical protein OXE87_07325 [Chloroflexi bacterium]|nr:hypothetical protein [Chloroflexota bacterium]
MYLDVRPEGAVGSGLGWGDDDAGPGEDDRFIGVVIVAALDGGVDDALGNDAVVGVDVEPEVVCDEEGVADALPAKRLDFDPVVVLDGGWNRVGQGEDADAPRRLYYVAMTRARRTLTLMRLPGANLFLDASRDVPAVLRRDAPVDMPSPPPGVFRRYRRLSMRDVFPGFSGYRDPAHPVHQAIAALNPGDSLQVRNDGDRWELLDGSGMMVGQLARSFSAPSGAVRVHASVLAVVSWDWESSEPEYRQGLRSDAWEVLAPVLVFEMKR